jgi:transcriptional regulator with XRE-family HTH domain
LLQSSTLVEICNPTHQCVGEIHAARDKRRMRKAYGAIDPEVQNNIRAHRNARKWTLPELGEKLGVTGETVRRWETTGELSVKQLLAVAEVFGVEPHELIPGGPDYTEDEEAFIAWLRAASAHDRRAVITLVRGLQEKDPPKFDVRKTAGG